MFESVSGRKLIVSGLAGGVFVALLLIAGSPAGAQCPVASESHLLFTEITEEAGLADDLYVTPSNHSLGMVWIDYDNNGFPDLYAVNGSPEPHHFYVNNGDGTFTKRDDLIPAVDPAIEMGGAVFGDYDNDGDSDIFVYNQHEVLDPECNCNPADGHLNMLFHNNWIENGEQLVEGEPIFVEVAAAAGVTGEADPPFGDDYSGRRTLSAAFVDYNRDGCLDIYTAQWAIRHAGEMSNQDILLENNCDGTFSDVTAAVGLPAGSNPDDLRATLAFIAAHLDDDLDPDLYAVNVSERGDPLPEPPDDCDPECPIRWFDMIWQNNGNGSFTEITHNSPGVGNDAGAGMGIDVADVELDGDWDIYISDQFATLHDELPLGNPFYKSNGDGTWADNSAVEDCVQGRFSWAVNFFDADHDGYEELFVGVMGGTPQDLLYYNLGDGTFQDHADAAGLSLLGDARGAAVADIERDGDLDFVVVEQGGGLRLMRNDTPDVGNWLMLQLEGVQSNADAIGAVVEVSALGKRMMRQIKGGSSAHSQDDLVMHFGLGDANVAGQVRVSWPSGLEEVYFNLEANTLYTLVEGEGPPTIVKVVPREVEQGAQGVLMLVKGQAFDPGAQARIIGGGVEVDMVEFLDENTLRLTISVDIDAVPGPRRLLVRNPDGSEALKIAAFTVI